ncbi:MAG: phytoene desaturase [Spirochaetaceae bacterium]|nr:MAG: phytoene desaturase [Spirochaetaceae bacterium]
MSSNAAVIGAGLGSLAAAIRLAAAGWRVDVYERAAGPGGKAGCETLGGYRFDSGPSLLTMPWVFDALFAAAGKRRQDYLEFIPLEIICKYFWDDGAVLRTFADRQKLLSELRRTTGESEERIRAYFERCRGIYDIAGDLFLEHNPREPSTIFSARFFKSLLRVGGIDAWRTMAEAHERAFQSPRLRQLFNRYATYNGSSPYRTPATLSIIPHVEYSGGGYAVRGGIYAIPRALERLARELGVQLHYQAPVERILHQAETKRGRYRVRGVVVGGAELEYDTVIAGADVRPVYDDLLQDQEAPDVVRYRRLEPSSSGLVFFWGMKRAFRELELHNIFFSRNYPDEFSAIFDRHECPADPTIYVNITSKVTPEDAPPGGENWFVLINAPCDIGQDWAAETARVRRRVIARISELFGFDLASEIAAESVMTPRDIQQRTNSPGGALYGISSNSRTAAFSRHPNRSRRYRGLYFCGGSTHPGGGMPLVLLSARITAELIARYQR